MTDAPAKPAAGNMNVQAVTPDDEKRRLADLCETLPPGEGETRAKPKLVKKPDPDDGLTQSERFIKAAQELGTDDDPERFADRVRKLAKAPPPKTA